MVRGGTQDNQSRYFLASIAGISIISLLLFSSSPSVAQTQVNETLYTAQEQGETLDPLNGGAILLQADQVTYNREENTVEASGHVEATYGDDVLLADKLIYYQKEDRVVADGHISITQKNGNTLFADHIELSDQMREGVISAFSALLDKNTRIASSSARRRDGAKHELTRVVYSACDVCDSKGNAKTPLWRVKAFRAIQNQEKLTVTYRDVIFELFGVPVFYTPYLSHADPSVKRKSGFLPPKVGTSNLRGTFAETPYYFALSPYYDLTVAPLFTTDAGTVLKANWRQRLRDGQYNLSGSITNTKVRDNNNVKLNKREVRGHIFGNGRYQFNDTWKIGYDLQVVNDDTYLRRYNISNEVDLETKVFARGIDDRNYIDISSYYFQGLLASDDSGLTPYILPLVEAHYVIQPWQYGRINIDANAMVLQRTQGTDSRRFSITADWERSVTTRLGQVITPFASIRADLYNTSDFFPEILSSTSTTATSDGNDTSFRSLPTIGVNWRWPFIRQGNKVRWLIEPMVQAVASSRGGNPDEIPNEDSQSFELDTSNLFIANKFPGLDQLESGNRLNVGVKFGAFFDDTKSVTFLFGQSLRTKPETEFTASTGLDGKKSDYVGTVDLKLGKKLSVIHQFRLDEDSLTPKRNEVSAVSSYGRYTVRAQYISSKGLNKNVGVVSRKELNINGSVRISKRWRVGLGARQDLIAKATRRALASLTYEDECTIFSISFLKRKISDRDIRPDSSILFQFTLKHLN